MKTTNHSTLEERFDAGEDMTEYMDLSQAQRPNQTMRCVNIDFPAWMVDKLDREAKHLGVARQALIKLWLAEHLSSR